MTNEEKRIARQLKGPSQMARVRAARAMIQARNSETLALSAFMSIFHPDFPEEKTLDMLRDVRERERQS